MAATVSVKRPPSPIGEEPDEPSALEPSFAAAAPPPAAEPTLDVERDLIASVLDADGITWVAAGMLCSAATVGTALPANGERGGDAPDDQFPWMVSLARRVRPRA